MSIWLSPDAHMRSWLGGMPHGRLLHSHPLFGVARGIGCVKPQLLPQNPAVDSAFFLAALVSGTPLNQASQRVFSR